MDGNGTGVGKSKLNPGICFLLSPKEWERETERVVSPIPDEIDGHFLVFIES